MIKPLGQRVLIKPQDKETTTKSGILIPEDTINPSFFVGEIIAVGSEVTDLQVGSIVAHKKYGMEVMPTDDGDRYLVEVTSVIALYE